MLDEDKSLLEELQEKLKEVELKLEELEDSGSDPEEADFIQVSSSYNQFFIHWIDVSETSFSGCDSIDSVEKAQQAFKEASEFRDNRENDKREVLHGDVMVLLCNTSKEDDGDGNISYKDACYYVGMCVLTDGIAQVENPIAGLKIASSTINGADTIKQFIAWDTCGGETVDIEGHTGDVVESRLGAPSYEASCSNDTTLVTLTFPVFNKTLTFEDGLLKEVSEESQGESLSTILNLPCCCDDEECRENVTFILSNTDSTLQNFEGTDIALPLSATLVNRNTANDLPNEPPDCSSIYDGAPTGFALEFTNRINNQAELRITTSLSGLTRSFYFIAPNDSDEPFRGVLNFDTSRNTGISTYTGTATIL